MTRLPVVALLNWIESPNKLESCIRLRERFVKVSVGKKLPAFSSRFGLFSPQNFVLRAHFFGCYNISRLFQTHEFILALMCSRYASSYLPMRCAVLWFSVVTEKHRPIVAGAETERWGMNCIFRLYIGFKRWKQDSFAPETCGKLRALVSTQEYKGSHQRWGSTMRRH